MFENSQIADPVTESYPKSMKVLREKLLDEKIIVTKGNKLILKHDYIFSSSSTAAMIVMGRSANGL